MVEWEMVAAVPVPVCKDFCKPIQLLRKKSEIELQEQPRFKVPTHFFVQSFHDTFYLYDINTSTVGPQTERPQAKQDSQMNRLQLDQKILELS